MIPIVTGPRVVQGLCEGKWRRAGAVKGAHALIPVQTRPLFNYVWIPVSHMMKACRADIRCMPGCSVTHAMHSFVSYGVNVSQYVVLKRQKKSRFNQNRFSVQNF